MLNICTYWCVEKMFDGKDSCHFVIVITSLLSVDVSSIKISLFPPKDVHRLSCYMVTYVRIKHISYYKLTYHIVGFYEELFAIVNILSLILGLTKIFVVLVGNCNQE